MRSPQELGPTPSNQGFHLSVLVNQPLLFKGAQSTQHLRRVAFANVLQLVRGAGKLAGRPPLAHVVKDVGLAALQLVYLQMNIVFTLTLWQH